MPRSRAQQDLILRVAQAYFDVLLAQDNVEFTEAQKTAIAEQLAQAKRNFEVGVATITDTNEAQARYDPTSRRRSPRGTTSTIGAHGAAHDHRPHAARAQARARVRADAAGAERARPVGRPCAQGQPPVRIAQLQPRLRDAGDRPHARPRTSRRSTWSRA